jgi:hypothetical protein
MLLAAAAGTGYWGLSSSDDNIRKFDRVSDAYAAVAMLQNNFEQMRMQASLASAVNDPADWKEF